MFFLYSRARDKCWQFALKPANLVLSLASERDGYQLISQHFEVIAKSAF